MQTYAARPVEAELQVECSGVAGQSIDVLVNQRKIGELTVSNSGGTVSLDQPITLQAGSNDIVLQYPANGNVTLRRLLIIPNIASEG